MMEGDEDEFVSGRPELSEVLQGKADREQRALTA
jgi:hypothetical protein